MDTNTTEIERRWLLATWPPSEMIASPPLEYVQGYLPGGRIKERLTVRFEPDDQRTYRRVIKVGHGLTRTEIGETIDARLFTKLWPLTLGRRLRKRRWVIRDGLTDLRWELTQVVNDMSWLVEVEFPDVASATGSLLPPPQLLIAREVTEDATFEAWAMAERLNADESRFIRAGRDTVCDVCGATYWHHDYATALFDLDMAEPPSDAERDRMEMRVVCDGTRVKL